MIGDLKRMIAAWLAPDMARGAERHRRMVSNGTDAFFWLGEFPEAQAALKWMVDDDRNHWRSLDEEARGSLPGDIGRFRDVLREGRHVELMRRDMENRRHSFDVS